jgi:hypothetical protein
VSVTQSGKTESGRLALWGPAADGGAARSLASRFGIPEPEDANGVTAVFNIVHTFIASVSTSVTAANEYRVPRVVLGDWVDLPALAVEAFNTRGAFSIESNIDLAGHGTLLRLIVVGNNSFHSRGDYNLDDSAAENNEGNFYADAGSMAYNNATPHLVFQFRNVVAARYMEATRTNLNGYAGCEMRQYLVPVTGVTGSGTFYTGLTSAGLPSSVLFAPKRYLQQGDKFSVDLIEDALWLPSEWEVLGSHWVGSNAYENARNQARLEYYQATADRYKYNSSNATFMWWLSSLETSNGGNFAQVNAGGAIIGTFANTALGVAPAFCVK